MELAQPSDIPGVLKRLQELKETFYQLALTIDSSKIKGKRNHTGFGYLNAKEWYALIEMHLRYHRKDKENIDKFLFSSFSNQLIRDFETAS